MHVGGLGLILILLMAGSSWIFGAQFERDQMDKYWPEVIINSGSTASVFLSIYEPKFVAYKELNPSLSEIAARKKPGEVPTNILQFTNEICANKELYGSTLLVNSFGLFLITDPYESDERFKEGHLVFAIEPILGGSFEHVLKYLFTHPNEIDVEWLKLVVARTALGIEYMHNKDWAWLDATPKNILIDHMTGYPKIADFGESKRLDDIVTSRRGPQDDWESLGSKIVEPIYDLIKKYRPEEEHLVEALLDAKLKLPVFTKFASVKNLAWFKDFDWEKAQQGTLEAKFIPKDHRQYLEQVYQDKVIIEKIINSSEQKPLNLLDPKSISNFTLDPKFLKKVNELGLGGESRIESADDYCNVLDPRKK